MTPETAEREHDKPVTSIWGFPTLQNKAGVSGTNRCLQEGN